ARKVCRAARSGDDYAQSSSLGLFCIGEKPIWSAMSGNHSHFVGNRKFFQQVNGRFKHFVVTLAAHHHADKRGVLHECDYSACSYTSYLEQPLPGDGLCLNQQLELDSDRFRKLYNGRPDNLEVLNGGRIERNI